MNDNGRLKGSVLSHESAELRGPYASKEIPTGLVLGAGLVLFLLTGCASAPIQGNCDPWQYNPDTGYPAVGVGFLQHM
jgi:hypothetical protein